MTHTNTAVTAAAGEFYVAYRCSRLNFVVAIPRANVPSIDLMVSTMAGGRMISIQVKTSSRASRTFRRNPANNRYEFDVGEKAKHLHSPTLFYAFVDLDGPGLTPRVFIVPSADVARSLPSESKRYMMWISVSDEHKYLERWDLLTTALTAEVQPHPSNP